MYGKETDFGKDFVYNVSFICKIWGHCWFYYLQPKFVRFGTIIALKNIESVYMKGNSTVKEPLEMGNLLVSNTYLLYRMYALGGN